MNIGQWLFFSCSGLLLAVVLWNEAIWHSRLRTWKRAMGKVVDFVIREDPPALPVVEYQADTKKQFVGDFALWNPTLGEEVRILHHPSLDRAVICTMRHRWCVSIFSCLLSLLFWLLASSVKS